MNRDPEDETCLSLLFANQVTDWQYSCTHCIKLVLFPDRGGYLAEEGAGGRAGGAPRQVEAVVHMYSEQNWFFAPGSSCGTRWTGRARAGSTAQASWAPRLSRRRCSLPRETTWWVFIWKWSVFILFGSNLICNHKQRQGICHKTMLISTGSDVWTPSHDKFCLHSKPWQTWILSIKQIFILKEEVSRRILFGNDGFLLEWN